MLTTLFFQGLLIGIAVAAPVGPIGILLAERTILFGRLTGVVCGLGAATADAIYGGLAVIGLSLIGEWLSEHNLWLRVVGGAFLLLIGLRSFFAPPPKPGQPVTVNGLIADFGSTALIAMTNPIHIVSFIAIFAAFGVQPAAGHPDQAVLLVAGIFAGAATWFTTLTVGVSLFRHRVQPYRLPLVRRISGIVIIGFALAAWGSAIYLITL